MNAGRGLVDRPFSLYTCFSPTTRPKYRAIKMEKKKKKKKKKKKNNFRFLRYLSLVTVHYGLWAKSMQLSPFKQH